MRTSLSTAFRSPGAGSADPGSASPVRTAASLPGFSFPQEASTHKTPNKTLNAGQLVPKIELDGQVQRRWAVALDPLRGLLGEPRNELFQHHAVDDLLDVAFPGQQPSAAGVPELVSHREGPAVLPQLQRSEALAVLLGAPADPLEDGSLQVVINQEVLDWQLLCRQLPG